MIKEIIIRLCVVILIIIGTYLVFETKNNVLGAIIFFIGFMLMIFTGDSGDFADGM